MKMDKERYEHLIDLADKAIEAELKPKEHLYQVDSQYKGHVAAFGVSVLMSGIKPTFAYFNDSKDKIKTTVLVLLGHMIKDDQPECFVNYPTAEELYDTVVEMTPEEEDEFRKRILEYAVALKHVIRTYKLV